MNNEKQYLFPVVMAVFLSIGLFLGTKLTPKEETLAITEGGRYQKLQDIIHILDKRYVDSIDADGVFEKAIGDMLHNLDPHSNYIPARDMKAMNEEIMGKFGGIGVRFFVIRDTVCITHVLTNSPSQRAGLAPGDKILKVDGVKLKRTISSEDVMGKLKGPEGTRVKLSILRDKKPLEKMVIRGVIPVESVTAAYMIDRETGFIRVERFSVETAVEFRLASQKLKAQGMKKLILDLRNNGGGVLTAATDITDEFLMANIPIVETRGTHTGKEVYRSTPKGILKDTKVAVLINSHSASASEILAGAIQDNDRGIIVGRRSFGKGLVQEDVLLRDGSNLRLTVARYYTPSGRCIQKPYSDDPDVYFEDQWERYENGEVYEVDSTKFVDSLKYYTSKGRVVYGGGGIMPDVFVPLDTTGKSWYITQLQYAGAFVSYSFDFIQDKRSRWKTPEQFADRFEIDDNLVADFVHYAAKEFNIQKDPEGLRVGKDVIKQILKGEIARQLWMEQGFFITNNEHDNEVKAALKSLR